MESSSVLVGNVQSHSAGEIFPFIVEVVENASTGIGYVQVHNCETGVRGNRWHYVRKGEGFNSFRAAHKAAEAEAARLLTLEDGAANRKRLRAQRVQYVQRAIDSILGYRGSPDPQIQQQAVDQVMSQWKHSPAQPVDQYMPD